MVHIVGNVAFKNPKLLQRVATQIARDPKSSFRARIMWVACVGLFETTTSHEHIHRHTLNSVELFLRIAKVVGMRMIDNLLKSSIDGFKSCEVFF